jgi:glyoxylase-like metal-dependent hydrolase (beta-lactamase superfamily II)
MTRDTIPDADLFHIKPVADGVFVAVATPTYKVNSNAAVVELEDGLLVVDTHSKPSAARALVRLLRDVSPKPVRYVVNTHFHFDHWQGNEAYPPAYPGVEVIATEIAREAIRRRGVPRIREQVRAMPAEIARLRAELAAATPEQRNGLAASLREAEAYRRELEALQPVLPTIAFDQAMRLVRAQREVELLYLGRAHTDGDLFVHLPAERVVVTGDAVIGWTPFMGDGYPEDWVRTLHRLEQLDFAHMIMGHGEVAGTEWLRFFRAYIADLVAAVRREAEAGASLEEVRQRVPDQLAPRYEPGLSAYGDYRPWRRLVLANIERVWATAR